MSRYFHAGVKGKMKYRAYSLFTSSRDGMSGQHQAPAELYRRELTPVPIG
jgi:hypothetical protein